MMTKTASADASVSTHSGPKPTKVQRPTFDMDQTTEKFGILFLGIRSIIFLIFLAIYNYNANNVPGRIW